MARFQLAEGEILVDAGRYKEAMAYYNKALRGRSDDTNLLYARAMVAENLGQLDIFERDLRRVLEISPNNAEALNALGYTLAARTRRFDEALHYISRAMELKPNNAFILDSMGWVHYRLGNYNKAEEYLLKAMQIHKDPEIAAHLGEVLWLKGDKAGARKVWQRSLEKNQGNKALLKVMQRFQK
jgi:Flp pilus assembly protein TadD